MNDYQHQRRRADIAEHGINRADKLAEAKIAAQPCDEAQSAGEGQAVLFNCLEAAEKIGNGYENGHGRAEHGAEQQNRVNVFQYGVHIGAYGYHGQLRKRRFGHGCHGEDYGRGYGEEYGAADGGADYDAACALHHLAHRGDNTDGAEKIIGQVGEGGNAPVHHQRLRCSQELE